MQDERIDNYVMGRMSDGDAFLFEQEILYNPELQQEVALHQELVLAIQMKGAKDYASTKRNRRRTISIWRVSSCFAVAACFVIGVFVNMGYSDKYKNIGNRVELLEYSVRGGSSLDIIYEKIQNNELRTALSLIEEEQSVSYEMSDPDTVVQYNAELQILEWYKAITYMRMGKWVKARKLLKRIAASVSFYKEQAQNILEQL